MNTLKDFVEYDFYINPQTGTTINVEDKLLLFDNLNDKNGLDISIDHSLPQATMEHDKPIKANFAMVLFCTEGEMRLQLNLKDITVKKNCIFAIMPGSIGKLYYISDDFKSASIFFSNTNYQPTLDIQETIKSQYVIISNPVVEVKDERMKDFIDIYKTLCNKLSDNNFKYRLELADAYINVLKVYWEDCNEQQVLNIPKSKPSRQKVIFDSFLNEIVQHYKEERSVQFYANKLFITSKYLSKVIKSVSNRQPSDWIRELVILEAKALLRTQQFTVQQISEQLNFTSPSLFGRYFRETVGCSPRKYQSK